MAPKKDKNFKEEDEDIVHALERLRENMNKASVAEAADGTPNSKKC